MVPPSLVLPPDALLTPPSPSVTASHLPGGWPLLGHFKAVTAPLCTPLPPCRGPCSSCSRPWTLWVLVSTSPFVILISSRCKVYVLLAQLLENSALFLNKRKKSCIGQFHLYHLQGHSTCQNVLYTVLGVCKTYAKRRKVAASLGIW